MAMKFPFQIVTPEESLYEDEIERVTVPTGAGEITILARHTPIISTLVPGELRIQKDDTALPMAVGHGFVEVRDDGRVIILAGSAERVEDIDIEKAQAARDRAQMLMEKHEHVDDEQFAKFEGLLEKEIARIRVATKYERK
ncbi:MAG: ATP synthase F1 subunit epsilon [Candidatus Paceibacterota bacterium]